MAVENLLTPLALKVGLSCLVAQCFLYVVFASSFFGRKSGPWTRMPGFTAHQVIVVPTLLFMALEGMREWLNQDLETPVGRLVVPHEDRLIEFVIGMMLFWDIPTGLLTSALREPAMVAHHFGMLATAATGHGFFSSGHQVFGYYSPFFFGVIELSSVPLVVVDIFHPKHKAWQEFLLSDAAPSWLESVNGVARIVFAASFLLVRTLWFPYISFFWVLPDVLSVTSLPLEERNQVPSMPLYFMATLNILFSLLQMYWGFLVLRQVIKLLKGPKEPQKKKD